MVSGIAAGNAVVTYTLPNGCERTALVTVNALPANITGTPSVCEGLTTSFNNGTPGGAWTSESDLTATVSGAGVVTGVAEGSAAITYTLGTGCYRTRTVSG
jgi:trimeric autotransporter adhesin